MRPNGKAQCGEHKRRFSFLPLLPQQSVLEVAALVRLLNQVSITLARPHSIFRRRKTRYLRYAPQAGEAEIALNHDTPYIQGIGFPFSR